MFEPQKDESLYRHPWRDDEEEDLTTDTNIQKEMLINQIANILRKSKQKGNNTGPMEEE